MKREREREETIGVETSSFHFTTSALQKDRKEFVSTPIIIIIIRPRVFTRF